MRYLTYPAAAVAWAFLAFFDWSGALLDGKDACLKCLEVVYKVSGVLALLGILSFFLGDYASTLDTWHRLVYAMNVYLQISVAAGAWLASKKIRECL